MKFFHLAPHRFQTIALSSVIAIGIVSTSIALRLKVAHHAATPPTEPPTTHKQTVRQTVNKPAVNKPAAPSTANTEDTPSPLSEATTPVFPSAAEPPTERFTAFNHLPYEEADPARLQVAGQFVRENFERTESLDLEAANAFIIMVNEAKAQGIHLMPISGYRSVADQQELFAKQTEKYGSEKAAAQLSAPAEYSEHHTGYAIDIGDGDRPEADLSRQFAETAAYQWLLNNADIFGFEQSFPEGNAQGLSFEPWHWRYVQSERAAQIFEAAKANETKTTETQQP